jgi:UMF1 family MFS transporter
MYDWANSAFMTVVVTAVFPNYFASVVAADLPPAVATTRFSIATTLALALIAVLAPILGVVADRTASKRRLLAAFMGLGAGATALLWSVDRGDWVLGLVLFGLANIGANGSFVFYDSLLPHLAKGEEADRVSTAGFALGYIGGGLALAVTLAMILKPAFFGLPSGEGIAATAATLPVRLGFLLTAAWWVVFSIPLFRRVSEPAATGAPGTSFGTALGAAVRHLGETVRELRRYRQAGLLLVAFLIYNDGIGTIIRMAGIFATEMGIGRGALIGAIVVVQFVGIPCAFLFGWLAGKIGAQRAVLLGLAVYALCCLLAYRMTTARDFLVLAFLVGLVQGGTQALSRSLFARMIPPAKAGEFFGVFGVFDKFAGILGPAVFGAIVAATGSSRNALAALIVFFVIGGWLLTRVDVAAGEREAAAG